MDVRLPDGTVINNVPDNITQTELLARLKKAGYDVDAMMSGKKPDEAPAKKEPERTVAGYAKEALKGVIPGLVGMGETAITGAAALLPEEAEQAIRKPVGEFAAGVRETFAPAPGYEDTIPRKLGEAVGSTIPFLPLGALGAAGRVAAAGLGVSAGAGEARQRAEQAGATEGERGAATALGTIPGALESLPPVRILRRFGFGDEAVKEVAGLVPALTRVAKAGGEEALQEASSQVLQNLIAKGVYKPDEAVLGGVGEAAGLGGGAGAVVSAIAELALGRRLRGAEPATTEEVPPPPPETPPVAPARVETPPNAPQEAVDAARDYVNKVASGEAKFNWMVGRKLLKAMNAEIPEGAKAADIRSQLEGMFPTEQPAAPQEGADLESLIGGEFADTEVPSGRRGRARTAEQAVADASGRSVDVSAQRPTAGESTVEGAGTAGLVPTPQPSVQPVSGEEVVEPALTEDGKRFLDEYGQFETYDLDDGAKYTGALDPDTGLMQGKGVYVYPDGTAYEGEFVKSKFQGQGKQTFPSGDVYEGEFKNDKYNGVGTFKYADGSVYEGQFKNGKLNGEGVYTSSDGEVMRGRFKNDKFLGEVEVTSQEEALAQDNTPEASDVDTPNAKPITTKTEGPTLSEDATDEDIKRYVEEKEKKSTAPEVELQEGDAVRVGNMPGTIIGVEGDYVKFRPVNARREKAYQRVPASMVTFESRPSDDIVSLSKRIEEQFGEEAGELNIDKEAMIPLIGANMYGSNIADVAVKEMLQNSFDAVKESVKKGQVDVGNINVSVNENDRTLTVEDDGVGMTPDIIRKAFFTIGGSAKELDPGETSGGLGMAKMGVLMGAERINIDTVRDGIRTTVAATRDEIAQSNFKINKQPAPKGDHGTKITLKIPNTYTDTLTGDAKTIWFPYGSSNISIFNKPLVGPAKVTFNDTVRDRKEELPIGVNFDTKEMPKLTTADTAWGTLEVYMGTNRKKYPKHNILSSGIWQFEHPFSLGGNEKIPYDIVVNVKSKVRAKDVNYPFENSRERFKPRVTKDIEALQSYLQRIARGEEAKELQQSFKDLVQMPRIEAGEDLKDTSKKLQKVFDKRRDEAPKKLAVPKTEEKIVISDEGVKDTLGKILVAAKPSDVQREQSFKADKAPPSMEDFKIVMEQDPKLPVFHNNTNVDYIKVGEEYGNPQQFFAELGTIVVEMKEALGNSGIFGYPRSYEVLKPENLFFGGISIDRGYGGIHLKEVPYKAIYLNPFYEWGAETLFGVQANIYETITHELAHTGDMSHGVGHNVEMIKVRQYLADEGLKNYFEDAILKTLVKHQSAFTAMKEAYGRSTTTNIAKSLEEYNKDATATSARSDKTVAKGSLRTVPTGKGRGRNGAVPPSGRGGKPGKVGAGVGGAGKVAPARVSAEKDVAETISNRKKAIASKYTKEGLVKRIRKYLWGDEAGANRLDLYERTVKTFQNELRPLEEWERNLRRSGDTIVGLPGFNNIYTLITNAQDKAAFYSSMLLKRPMDSVHKGIEAYARMRNISSEDALEELDRLRVIKHEPERRQVLFILTAPLSKKRRTFKMASGKTMRASPAEIRKMILEQLVKPGVRLSPEKSQALRTALNSIVADKKNLDPLGDSPIAKEDRPLSTDINSADYNVFGGYTPEFVKKLSADYDRLGPNVRGAAEKVLSALEEVQKRTRQLNQEGRYWSNSVSNIVDFYGFKFYTPFKGRSGTERSAITDPNDRRISGEFAQADQAMEGRESEADNSVLQDLSDAMYAAARAGRAGVTEAVKNAIEQKHIKGEKIATITPAQRYLDREFDMRPYKGDDKIFHYDNDGNIEVYKISPVDRKLLEAIRRPYQETNWAVKMANGLTGFFGQMHTRFNPSFAPLNFPRDVFTNSLTIASDLGGKQAARYFTDALLTNVMKGGLRKSYKISRMIAAGDEAGLKRLAAKSDFARDTLEYLEKGGRTAYQQAYNISAQADTVSRNLNRSGVVAATQKGLESVADLMDSYNDAFEFTNRVAAYTMAKNNAEATMKQEFKRRNNRAPNATELAQIKEAAKEEGATIAKNLANFRLVGTAGREAGALFMFFRTAATGAARAIDSMLPALVSYETALARAPESVRKNPESTRRFKANYETNKKRAMWTMFITAAAGAFLYELGLAFADDDEEGRNRVATDDMARWTRYARMPVLGKDTFLQIPWGFGIAAFGAWGAQVAAVAHGNSAPKDFAANGINIAFDSFIPLPKSNINVFDNFAGFLVDSVAPTAIRPFVEYAMNTDNLGNDIYNSRQSRYSDVFTGGTNIPEFYKNLAKDYYEMTGFEVSPNTIYFWTSNYADALSRVATSVYDLRMFASGRREFRSVDDLDKVVPFIDSFIGTKSNYDARQFSAVEKQIKEKEQRLNSIKNRPDDYVDYVNKNPLDEEIVDSYNKQINQRLKALREEANYIRTTSELTPQEKRDMLKDNTRMQNMAKRDIIDSFKIYYGIEPK